MAEIEVGEYVRTNKGNIFIYANAVDENDNLQDYILVRVKNKEFDGYYDWQKKWFKKGEYITKHSKNIIDLIEVEDYVNGCLVLEVCLHSLSGAWIEIESNKQSSECTLWNDDIKSIVTKETFKSMEYRVEE